MDDSHYTVILETNAPFGTAAIRAARRYVGGKDVRVAV